MKFRICAIGRCKNLNLLSLIENYTKRIGNKRIEIIEIKASNATQESEALLLKSASTYRILLDESGRSYSSTKFVDHISNSLRLWGCDTISFLIGGADGHSNLIKKEVQDHLSISSFTLPHMLARLVLVEQIYRLDTIARGHPYHRD